MFLDQLFASSVQADVVDFRIHDFRQTLQHLRVRHVDLVQQDPLAFLKTNKQLFLGNFSLLLCYD